MKRLAAAIFTVFACTRAQATDNTPAIEALKERALQAVVAADAARRDPSCTAIWFGGVSDARPFHLSLTVDSAVPFEHAFTPVEAQALANNGLFHFDCLRLGSGTHHLQATLFRDIGGDKPPQTLLLERDLEPPPAGTLLELRLRGGLLGDSLELSRRRGEPYQAAGGWRTRLGLAEPEESADWFVLGGAGDPRVRQAQLLLDTGHALSAAALLRELAADSPDAAPRFALELAQAELAYGLSADAEARWRAAPDLPAVRAQRASLSLHLARVRYQRGDPAAGLELLGTPQAQRGPHPDPALTARQQLYATLLLAQGRQEQAAEVLRDTFNAADYDSWVGYYNLGVALVQGGRVPQGLTVLNRVGNLASDEPLLRRLRDHANLALARHFLEAGQGGTAIPLFGGIDSTGPDSASALLGLGWAWLVPPGTAQPEMPLGDEIITGAPPETRVGGAADPDDQNLYLRFHLAPFAQEHIPADEAARLRRALAAWVRVADRKEDDGQAGEALIDIAWALRRVESQQQAAQYDEQAVAALEQERTLVDAAAVQARDEHGPDLWLAADTGIEPGLPWEMPALPPPPSGPLLIELIASHPFQDALHDYRDLRLLRNDPGIAGDEAARATLGDALQAQRLRLRELQLDALALHRRHLEALLIVARSALSAVYDSPGAATAR